MIIVIKSTDVDGKDTVYDDVELIDINTFTVLCNEEDLRTGTGPKIIYISVI